MQPQPQPHDKQKLASLASDESGPSQQPAAPPAGMSRVQRMKFMREQLEQQIAAERSVEGARGTEPAAAERSLPGVDK